MSSIRELLTCRESQLDPSFGVALVCQVLRAVHGESTTIEGCAASWHHWVRTWGKPCRRTIRAFLESLGGVADVEIEQELIVWAIDGLNRQ